MDAIKLEGGSPKRIETVQAVVNSIQLFLALKAEGQVSGGVAVMGHIGLMPQANSVAATQS